MSSVAIAAMFGHSSVVTAKRHYGHARSGFGGTMVRPSNQNINSVIAGLTDAQIEVMQGHTLERSNTKEKGREFNPDFNPQP